LITWPAGVPGARASLLTRTRQDGTCLMIQLEGLRKEQKWTPGTLQGLIDFVHRVERQELASSSNKELADAYKQLGKAIVTITRIRTAPPDLVFRLTELQYELMGEKPLELSWSQWRTWNLAPFFSGAKKWPACEFFLEAIEAKQQVSAGAMKVAHSRMRSEYGSLPLDSQIAFLLDRMKGRRKRSRISIITNRSAYPRLQLALRRNSRA